MHAYLRKIAAISLLFAAPYTAQADGLSPVPVPVENVTDIDPALWAIKDDDTTIYLFGTVHILKPGLGWFDDGVKSAFDASDTLVMEMIDPSPEEQAAIMSELSIDQSGKTMRERLPAEDRAVYEAALAKLKVPAEALDPYDAWAVALNLYMIGVMQNGYDLNQGVETQLEAAAKASGKPMLGLETFRQQITMFDTLPADVQLRYVTDTAKSMDQIAPQLDKLVGLWGAADTEGFAAMSNESFEGTNLAEPLINRRNANWAKWIDARMALPGTVFIAVGAGHLAGEKSVQQMLLPYGLKAEQVQY
jgi:uncharacterized protein